MGKQPNLGAGGGGRVKEGFPRQVTLGLDPKDEEKRKGN